MILAKTIKGYGLGKSGEGQNISPSAEKSWMKTAFATSVIVSMCRSRMSRWADVPYYHPGEDSEEVRYLKERAATSSVSYLPQRRVSSTALEVPELEAFESITKGSGDREISTTMAFVPLPGGAVA